MRNPTLYSFFLSGALAFGLVFLAASNAFASENRSGTGLSPVPSDPQRVTVDGVSWSFNRVGSGEPLLLVHGFGASKDSWNLLIPYLIDGYEILAVDLPGFGESDKPEDLGYGARQQAERLYRFAKELGLEKWHIAGNSMGGSIAGELAAAHPEAIRSLWLIAPAGVKSAQPSDFDRHMANGGENLMIPKSEAAFDRMLAWLYHQPPAIPQSIKAGIVDGLRGSAAAAARAHADLVADWPALEESLDGFSKPTLITWGEEDRFVHVSGAMLLSKRLPNATVDLIPDCGHVPMLERPADCAARFRAFAAGL